MVRAALKWSRGFPSRPIKVFTEQTAFPQVSVKIRRRGKSSLTLRRPTLRDRSFSTRVSYTFYWVIVVKRDRHPNGIGPVLCRTAENGDFAVTSALVSEDPRSARVHARGWEISSDTIIPI